MTSSSTCVYDDIVIGAGVEGSSSAYNLAKKGRKVLLLEQFPLPHSRGSSHGHSRITRYVYEDEFYVRMMVDAFPMWAELEREAETELFINCGVLDLRQKGSAGCAQALAALRAHNIPHELMGQSELRRRYPMVRADDGVEAVWDPNGGVLRADRCVSAFQTVFKRLGGVLHDSEPVTSVVPGEAVTVVTSRAVYKASNVVIAAGSWAGRFTATLGLDIPLQPVVVSVLYWKTHPGHDDDHKPLAFPCIIDSTGEGTFHLYSLPTLEYPGLVKACLHQGPLIDPERRDVQSSQWVEDALVKNVTNLLPWLQGTEAVIKETCIYTNTPDHAPYIARHPKFSNIILAAGFSGHGFKLAPAVGKAVSELALGQSPTYDMNPFRLDRFSLKSML